jgi:hypothetical protein
MSEVGVSDYMAAELGPVMELDAIANVLLTIKSGRRTPMAETPTPALAVP